MNDLDETKRIIDLCNSLNTLEGYFRCGEEDTFCMAVADNLHAAQETISLLQANNVELMALLDYVIKSISQNNKQLKKFIYDSCPSINKNEGEM